MKYLLVLLVVVIAIQIWRSNRRKAVAAERAAAAAHKPRLRHPEDMVRCAHCGVHLPASDALATAGDAVFCSAEHRRLGARVE